MLPAQQIDQTTLQRVRELIRANFVTRDELYASAEALDDVALAEICRRLADGLGGNAADLQQQLMMVGEQPAEPHEADKAARQLQEIVTQMLEDRHGPSAVLSEAASAEQRLKEEYDDAIDATPDNNVEGLLRRQREDVVFGETVLQKVRETGKETTQ